MPPINRLQRGLADQRLEIGVSSYSSGVDYMLAGLKYLQPTGLVREVIDLDSPLMTRGPSQLSGSMAPRTVVITQISRQPTVLRTFYRPTTWWGGYASDQWGQSQVHDLIFRTCLFAALKVDAHRP